MGVLCLWALSSVFPSAFLGLIGIQKCRIGVGRSHSRRKRKLSISGQISSYLRGLWLLFSEKVPFFRRRTSCLNYVWPPSAAGRKEKVVKDVLPPPSLPNFPSLFLLSWVGLGQLSVQISLVSELALLRSKNKFFRSPSSDEEAPFRPPSDVGDAKFSGRLKISWSTNLTYCSQLID